MKKENILKMAGVVVSLFATLKAFDETAQYTSENPLKAFMLFLTAATFTVSLQLVKRSWLRPSASIGGS